LNAPSSIRLAQPQTAAEWDIYYDLRWRVLRAPWNQPRGSERDALESESVHLLASIPNGAVSGVGRLHFNSPHQAQIRFMAVAENFRGQGIGSRILQELERRARERGATSIVLEARDTAVPFYVRNGYATLGPGKTLFGALPHQRMRKEWAAASVR
jgi:GNAT superfamily N-acetyltransferase